MLTIRAGDWIVFSTGMGVLTWSQVLEKPCPPTSAGAPLATVKTVDGLVFRRLVVASYPRRQQALDHAHEFNTKENENA